MIEMISMANWTYLKSKLKTCYQEYLIEEADSYTRLSFSRFVEDVFLTILRWNQISERAAHLDIINGDAEFALDLLEAIDLGDNSFLQDADLVFNFNYIDSLGMAIIEAIPADDPPEAVSDKEYRLRVESIRKSKLTTLVRMLDVLRLSKGG